ncbi:MAG TPA: enolase C-terminal domain-like protein [Chloroflexota bacterium]|nr:enolase C-terminal domain-like protein [Chloroflexota bacterium]
MSGLRTDVSPIGATLTFLPVQTRVPLKFGPETLTTVICARVALTVQGRDGRRATGWGETPLSVQWVWPSVLSFAERQEALLNFCRRLTGAWAGFACWGHALEVGYQFQQHVLIEQLRAFNAERGDREAMPYLAALVCCSPFDLAVHDAFGALHGLPTYQTYCREWLSQDLAAYLTPAEGAGVDFHGRYPGDFLVQPPPTRLVAWHLVGGKDALTAGDLDGSEPDDGYPVLLRDWIRRDGLTCLKVKLRGDDSAWDYARLLAVGQIAVEEGCRWLSADFNCTVTDPVYVTAILDRLLVEEPRLYAMLLYVEQPFPYELEQFPLDVHAVSARKPLFLDESAHDWQLIALGRSLGWSGVALKTCKTQTGALLSLSWAKAHGMPLMVQDLTNPMLAQIPHVLLAAHAGTIMGVETNAMQFYPDASLPEARVHPGLYRRRQGAVALETIGGPGFGYHLDKIERALPAPDTGVGDLTPGFARPSPERRG